MRRKILWMVFLSILFFIRGNLVSDYIEKKDLYKYSVYISGFNDILFDYQGSYLTDEKGRVIDYFGGYNATTGALGHGVQNSGDGYKKLPNMMHVLFFDPIGDQFWKGEFNLPYDKIKVLFSEGYMDVFRKDEKGYSLFNQLIIVAVPSGQVFVYLGNGQVRFVGGFQAQKINMDWDEFYLGLGYPKLGKLDREAYVTDARKYYATTSPFQYGELKRDPSAYEAFYWQRYFKQYDWRLVTALPFTLERCQVNLVNGEVVTKGKEEIRVFRNAPVPQMVSFVIKDAIGKETKILMKFNQQSVMEKFEEAAKLGEKIEFHADYDEKLETLDTYLTIQGNRVELEAEYVENQSDQI